MPRTSKVRLTAAYVAGLEGEPGRRLSFIADSQLRGFGVRLLPSGDVSYTIVYRNTEGKRRWFSVGSARAISLPAARRQAEQLLARVALGVDIAEERAEARDKRKADTLGGFLRGEYLDWARANRRNGAGAVQSLVCDLGPLEDMRLADITPLTIERWRKGLLSAAATGRKLSTATINRKRAYLSAALGKAVDWGLIPENPARRTHALKEDRGRPVRRLMPDELERLFTALEERNEEQREARRSHLAWCTERGYPFPGGSPDGRFMDYGIPLITLLLTTGFRAREALMLAWADVDFEQRTVRVQGAHAKSYSTRIVPMSRTLTDVLSSWREQCDEGQPWVFTICGERLKSATKLWNGLRKRAGLPKARLHDLRHTYGSMLAEKGADIETIRALMGHSALTTTARYLHSSESAKAEAVARTFDTPKGEILSFPAKEQK